MSRGGLADAHWCRLAPLPPQRIGKAGHPPHDQQRMLSGRLWVLRTVAMWRDLQRRYGRWASFAVSMATGIGGHGQREGAQRVGASSGKW